MAPNATRRAPTMGPADAMDPGGPSMLDPEVAEVAPPTPGLCPGEPQRLPTPQATQAYMPIRGSHSGDPQNPLKLD